MASDNNNQDTEEEISTVLRHFRPRPEFLSNNSGSSHEWMTSGTNKKQKKSLSRGFTSVQYVASPSSSTTDNNNDGVGKIRLAYLHIHTPKQQGSNNNSSSKPVFLTFEIAVDTKVIECVRCSSSISISSSTDLQSDLNEKCSILSTTTTNNDDAASLFLSASQLLKLLNDDFPDLIIGKEERETFFMLTSRIAKAIDDNKFAFQYKYDMIDVQTLLIRCAAAGKQRSQVCAPVPVEFTSSASIRGDDTLSHLIFGASNQLYLVGFRGDGMQEEKSKQFVQENKDARTLLTFLLSLPWTGGSRLINNKASSSASGSSNQATKTATSSTSKMAKISIDIGTAMGSPSPAFTAQATKYGTIQAYHGTKIESAWSIINHGLINLSYHKLQSNGAMMGEGVYLSSSKQVADSFAQTAAQQKSAALASAFQHEALLHLLCFANVDISDLEPLENYDITCLPVFEAMIIRPPSGDDEDEDDNDNDNLQCTTRQEGKYFVCTDSEFIRITKLHLTIELRKKTSMWGMLPRIPLWLIVVILALLWMIR